MIINRSPNIAFSRLLMFACLTLFLCGCSTTLNTFNKDLESANLQENGIVFGKMVFSGFFDGKKISKVLFDIKNIDTGRTYIARFLSQEGDRFLAKGPVKPQYFFYELPSGRYQIFALRTSNPIIPIYIDVYFDVSAGRVYYLGSLEIGSIKSKAHLGPIPLPGKHDFLTLSLDDEYTTALEAFHALYPGFDYEIEKNLFAFNEMEYYVSQAVNEDADRKKDEYGLGGIDIEEILIEDANKETKHLLGVGKE